MKKIFLLSATCLSAFVASSQAFEMGKSYISLGWGVGNLTQAVIKAAATGADVKYSGMGPAFAKYEYAIADNLGIGMNFAYLSAKVESESSYTDGNGNPKTYTETIRFNTWSILGRVNYHLSDNENIDPYIGIGMGYRNSSWKWESNDPDAPAYSDEFSIPSPFGMDMTFGTRFMITPNFGLYAEVGIAKAVVQGGLALKF